MDVQRELQAHAQTRIIEIIAGDFAHAVEPVEHGVAVDTEPLRRFLGAAVRGEEGIEGADQIGVVLPVVGEQCAERLGVEITQFRQLLRRRRSGGRRPDRRTSSGDPHPAFAARAAAPGAPRRASAGCRPIPRARCRPRPRRRHRRRTAPGAANSSRSVTASRAPDPHSAAGSTNSAPLLRMRQSTRPPRVVPVRAIAVSSPPSGHRSPPARTGPLPAASIRATTATCDASRSWPKPLRLLQ